MVQLRTEVDGKPARRTRTVTEIIGLDSRTQELLTNEVYRWDAKHDVFPYSGRSYILEEKIKRLGISEEEVRKELLRRKIILDWMVKNGIRKHIDVASVIREYYADPARVYRKARLGMT